MTRPLGLLVGSLLVVLLTACEPAERPTPSPAVQATATVATGVTIETTGAQPTPAPTPPPPAPANTPAPAVVYVGNTNGQGVYLRRTHSLGDRDTAYRDGTELKIVGPETQAEGLTWLRVQAPDGREGWVPEQYTTSAPRTAQATSPPTNTPLPAPASAAAPQTKPTQPPPTATSRPAAQAPAAAASRTPAAPPAAAPATAAPSAGVIESQIDGDFEGWDGETLFPLTNGQYWQQASYAYLYHYAYGPSVFIQVTPDGGVMQVEGVRETVKVRNVTGNVVKSRIRGEFQGWDGSTIFPLENGQVWQQARYAYHYRYAYGPSVLIYPSSGGYVMKLEHDAETVRVRRLR